MPNGINTYTFMTLGKMNKYIAYLDMTLPSRLQTLGSCVKCRKNILSFLFGITMSEREQLNVIYHELPEPFQNQGYHSNFFVNFMDGLTSLVIMFGIGCMFVLFEWVAKRQGWITIQDFCRSIKLLLNFNWILVLFAIQIDDIIIYASLEFQTLTADSAMAVVSFLTCLFMVLFIIVLLLGIVYIGYLAHTYKSQTAPMMLRGRPFEFTREWKYFQVVFAGLKNNALTSQLFYFVYLWRTGLSALLAAALYSAPGPQTVLQLLVSTLILIYILVKRPIRNFVNFIQLSIVESIYFVINLSMVVIVCFIAKEDQEGRTAVSFGDFVIVGNLILNILPIVFLVIKLILEGKEIYDLRKRQPDESKIVWLQLLTVLLQQGAYGFEELIILGFPEVMQPPSPKKPRKFFPIKEPASKPTYEFKPKRPSILLGDIQAVDLVRPLQALVTNKPEPAYYEPEYQEPLQLVIPEAYSQMERTDYHGDYRVLTPDRVKNRPLKKNPYILAKLGGTGKNEMRKSYGLESEIDLGDKIDLGQTGLGMSRVDTRVGDSIESPGLLGSQLIQHQETENSLNYSMNKRSLLRPGTGGKKSAFFSQDGGIEQQPIQPRFQRNGTNHLSIDMGNLLHPNASVTGSGVFLNSPGSEAGGLMGNNGFTGNNNYQNTEQPMRLLSQLHYSTIDSPKDQNKFGSGNNLNQIFEEEVNRLE